ncbi:MAG TPA: CDP-alcohol phosphatidyltransferase family protein [Kofleriaceae bacterium]|nr:CDP-alcohol phosphatidyltransferase family protein [Kofleriaceae bacterium]
MMPQTSSVPTPSSPTAPDPAARWALIDAGGGGEIGPTTVVAGLPMVVRLVRLAARAGWQGAVVVGGERAGIERALARWPVREGFTVELAEREPDGGGRRWMRLDGRSIYLPDELTAATAEDRDPVPMEVLATRAQARKVTGTLLMRTRKSVDQDGVVSFYTFRPLSRTMTRILLHTPVTPNMVSLAAMAFGIAAAVCGSFGGYQMTAIAGALFWFGAVVDCVDGELARLRLQGSKLGEWLDTLADDVSTYGLLAGVGIGMVRDGWPLWWGWTVAGSAALGFLLNVKVYLDLHRWGMVIDTARYPWFTGTPAKGDHGTRGFWGWVMYGLNMAFRRDAVTTSVAALFIIGWRFPAVSGALLGVFLFTLLFVVHGIVHSRRRKPDEESFWAIGYFGVKDLFTIVNLVGGVLGIYYAMQGALETAGYAIFLGYLLGDALDGPVARWTGTSNRFGGEFDAAADHIGQAIAPAVIVFRAFQLGGHTSLGVVLMAVLITTASIRQARFQVAHFNYPLTYCGLPRTISGLVALSLPNSILFFKYSALGYYGAAAVLVLVALLNLSPIPYMTHKGKRKMQPYVKFFVILFLAVPPLMILFAREFVYDVIFFITFGYALAAWIPLRPEERRAYWTEYKRWSTEVASKK